MLFRSDVDEPIEVSAERVRSPRGRDEQDSGSESKSDPLMGQIEARLQAMLANLADESTPYSP